MDCGIALDLAARTARCVAMTDVTLGLPIVVGYEGVRVVPAERPRDVNLFGFMSSNVSSEKPKAVSLQSVAESIRQTRAAGKKVLLVGGPAIVHTGSSEQVARLMQEWENLSAALAAHE